MRKMLFTLFAGIFIWGCKKDKDGTVTVVPISPTELTATVISTTQVNLSWTDKSTNETGFKVQRKTGSGAYADIATVNKDITTYSDNGLTPATTYTYRVYAYNSTGASLSYTNEVTVTTFGSAVLTTTAITNISNTSAKSGGTITSDGGSPITARGIVWSTTSNPTVALTTKTIDGTGTGSFISNLTGVTANTTYYVRAYATNSAGTSYGNEVSFKTLNVDITTGLVAFYPFNGNANDESGNNNNGVVNGATLTTDRFGNTGKAYSFDGLNTFIEVASNSSLQLTSNYTLNGWFNANVFFYSSNADRSILSKVESTGWYGGYEVIIGGNTKDIAYAGNVGGNNFVVGSIGYAINTWYMFTVTFDGSTIKLFMNGMLVNSKIVSGNLQTSNLPLLFGRRGGSIQGKFDGKLDDVRIYNRALTQEEITYLANN